MFIYVTYIYTYISSTDIHFYKPNAAICEVTGSTQHSVGGWLQYPRLTNRIVIWTKTQQGNIWVKWNHK